MYLRYILVPLILPSIVISPLAWSSQIVIVVIACAYHECHVSHVYNRLAGAQSPASQLSFVTWAHRWGGSGDVEHP